MITQWPTGFGQLLSQNAQFSVGQFGNQQQASPLTAEQWQGLAAQQMQNMPSFRKQNEKLPLGPSQRAYCDAHGWSREQPRPRMMLVEKMEVRND